MYTAVPATRSVGATSFSLSDLDGLDDESELGANVVDYTLQSVYFVSFDAY